MASRSIPAKLITTCDKCGSEYDGHNMTLSGLQMTGRWKRNDAQNHGRLDMCKPCAEVFNRWIKGEA